VPNRHIIGEVVRNSFGFRIVESSIGISYDADPAQAIAVLEAVLARTSGVAERPAAMVGINVTRVKVLAFAAAAAVAGLGGGLFIHYSTYIDHDMVALPLAIASVTYPLLGGLGSFVGTLLGALVLVGLTEGLRVLHELREFVYGALIILTMIFRPRGIVDEALVLRVKSWFSPRAARRPVETP
jgi:branched-chain amino acid transport system permease protein